MTGRAERAAAQDVRYWPTEKGYAAIGGLPKQHCGRLDDHDGHEHRARLRPVVVSCVCDKVHCLCPSPEPTSNRRRLLWCEGKQVTTPSHMPTVVSL